MSLCWYGSQYGLCTLLFLLWWVPLSVNYWFVVWYLAFAIGFMCLASLVEPMHSFSFLLVFFGTRLVLCYFKNIYHKKKNHEVGHRYRAQTCSSFRSHRPRTISLLFFLVCLEFCWVINTTRKGFPFTWCFGPEILALIQRECSLWFSALLGHVDCHMCSEMTNCKIGDLRLKVHKHYNPSNGKLVFMGSLKTKYLPSREN